MDSLVERLRNQREWSEQTFGPGDRLAGILDHIRKELVEVEDNPTDVSEWVDVIILAFDGAWRAGWEPELIVAALDAKYAKNRARNWPDWRTAPEGQAIEHIREDVAGHDFATCSLPECGCMRTAPHDSHDWESLSHRWCCPGIKENAS